MNKTDAFKNRLQKMADKISKVIAKMPEKGLIEEDSQKLVLINRLRQFEFAINGIESSDLSVRRAT